MEKSSQLLQTAVGEIRNLRHQNELMSARLDMFDSMMAVLHTPIATKSKGMSPDLTWEIDKFLEREEASNKIIEKAKD